MGFASLVRAQAIDFRILLAKASFGLVFIHRGKAVRVSTRVAHVYQPYDSEIEAVNLNA